MTASKIMAKRAAAGTLALAVCLTGGLVSAGAANAAPGFTFNTRIAGDDRYETAIAASKAAFPTTASAIVITNGLSEVDGLTASYVAGLNNAPILYSSGPDGFSANTTTEMNRLAATKVFIVGGTTVVSAALETQLKAKYGEANVTRYGGSDRYDTAARVATSNGATKPGKVIVANGASYADALVAGPVAYKQKYPILLTTSTGVPAFTSEALRTLAVPTVKVIGGTAVVSDATYTEVGGDVRLGGDTRQDTAVSVASDAIANEGFSSTSVALVGNTNANAADALVAAPFAAKTQTGVPLLFVDNNGTAKPTATYLTANSARLTGTGYVFGGTTAVSAAAVATAQAAAQSTATGLGSIAITPAATVSQALVGNETVSGTNTQAVVDADNRVYTASNLIAGETYRVTLVNANSVRVDANGGVTFLSSVDTDSPSGFSVNTGADLADIVKVNSTAVTLGGEARTTTAVPVNGSITFEVDGGAVGTVIPVIYLDGGAGQTAAQGGTSIRLETVATTAGTFAAASEAFGLGGAITYTGAAAASGAVTAPVTITSVDKDANTFTAGNVRYTYDANDAFSVGGTTVGITAFEAALTPGDTFGASAYSADPELASSFQLTNVASATTAATAGTGTSTNDIGLTATISGTTDQVIVQRAPVVSGTVGTFATIATVAATSTSFTYADNDLAAGSYQYRIAEVRNGQQVDFGTASATVAATTPDSTAPTALDTRVGVNTGSALLLETGDSFTIAASEALAAATTSGSNRSTLRLTDGDGTVVEVVASTGGGAGVDNTFALNSSAVTIGGTSYAANRVLTVTLGSNATVLTVGSTAGLGIPSTITTAANVTDVAGNNLSLSTSADVVIDVE